ncbi:uncharacterized protein N7511_002038 [Penicillium nucicola]|uniref:uncharacterized protein n=1 Tax=Penicillium nucicola TaxID=1850975 RepID=UPI00254583FE|nr:uncharacterized protein N7511_002038 [Penicillium nucicola]KAJ5769987.1 hypothetical protein N7511_002038 [Penicillium nucicola]
MKCLIRFEADGYLPDISKSRISEPAHDDMESISASIGEASISDIPLSATPHDGGRLCIEKRGRYIPHAAVYDLKTRSINKKGVSDTLGEELARLWIAQIPNFILAYHKFGKFEDIQVQDVSEKVKQWETDHQSELVKFSRLLQTILSFARSSESGRFEIEREEGGKCLNLREQGGVVNRVLSPALRKKCDLGHHWNDIESIHSSE